MIATGETFLKVLQVLHDSKTFQQSMGDVDEAEEDHLFIAKINSMWQNFRLKMKCSTGCGSGLLLFQFLLIFFPRGKNDETKTNLFLLEYILNGPTRHLFIYFRSFQKQFYRKIADFCVIRTQIAGVEGEHAHHLTTTTARLLKYFFT